ncbi:MAG TPA: tetratricopeptide repeat protein [Terriglobia bacterium]|nr:tetratricopeptide repeat protein [Terriglobia bacterium]
MIRVTMQAGFGIRVSGFVEKTGLSVWTRGSPTKITEPQSSSANPEPRTPNPASTDLAAWSDLTLLSLLVALASLPYLNTLLNSFVYDDDTQVLNNPYLHSLHYLPRIFSTTVWSYVGGARGRIDYYRPVMTLGYLICYRLFGPLASGFHLVSIVLHAAVVCLLFAVTVRMFRHRGTAFAAAALFALHPIHSESVAWIAAVTDLELTLFYLLAFWFFLGEARPDGRCSASAQMAMLASFMLALLSKEQAFTLPLVATVYEHAYREDSREATWRQKLARYGTLWLVALVYLLFRVRFFGSLAPATKIAKVTWPQAFLSACALTGHYLGKLVWPLHLSAFYVFHKSATMRDPRVIAGALGLALAAALFVLLWRRGAGSRARLTSLGVIWMVVTLAPVLNARWTTTTVFAERYLYLPSVGFAWIVGWGLVALWEAAAGYNRAWRESLAVALVMVAALCMVRIVTRNRDWRDDVALYTQTLSLEPDAYFIRNNLGVAYWAHGDAEEAERQWARALQDAPHEPIILNNLGLASTHRKQYSRAVELFQRAMRLRPDYTDAYLNLGVAYSEMGLLDQAESQLHDALALSPLSFDAHNRLGELHLKQERFDEAKKQFEDSVRSLPNGRGYDDLGDVCLRQGGRERAESAFRQAIVLNAFDSHAHFGLAAIEAAGGRNAEAIRDYEVGLENDPNNREARAAVAKLRALNAGGPASKP